MPQVSRRILDKSTYNRIFEILLKSFAKAKTIDDASLMIDDLLTSTEKTMLAKRLSIALLLKKGYSYEEIIEVLKVSRTTVARVKEKILTGSQGYKKILDRILKEEAVVNFFEKIDNVFLAMIPSYGKGSGVWREIKRKRRQERIREAGF